MKKMNLLALAFPLFGGLSAYAQGGHVGGGDPCRNEINKHRQIIADWIESGDASELDFSKAQIKGLNFSNYQERMLEALTPGKVVVTCYFDPGRMSDPEAQKIASEKGVAFKAITLGKNNLPSACVNYEDQTGISHIDCNYDSIVNQQSLGDPNYVLTHHEYASIAGVELRKTDSEPDFSISNQIAQFENWVTVKVLGKRAEVQKHISNLAEGTSLYSLFNFKSVFQGEDSANLYQKNINYHVFAEASQKWPYQTSDVERLQGIVKTQAGLEFDRIKTQMDSKWLIFSRKNRLSSGDLQIAWKARTPRSQSCNESKDGISCNLSQADQLILTSKNLALLVSFKSENFRENPFWGVPLVSNRARKKRECQARFDEVSKDPSVLAIMIDDRLKNYGAQTQQSECQVNYIYLELR